MSQPLPITTGASQDVFKRIQAEFEERNAKGLETYGKTLETFNGRNAYQDHREELLDAYVYSVQAEMERDYLLSFILELAGMLVSEHGDCAKTGLNDDGNCDVAELLARARAIRESSGVPPRHGPLEVQIAKLIREAYGRLKPVPDEPGGATLVDDARYAFRMLCDEARIPVDWDLFYQDRKGFTADVVVSDEEL